MFRDLELWEIALLAFLGLLMLCACFLLFMVIFGTGDGHKHYDCYKDNDIMRCAYHVGKITEHYDYQLVHGQSEQ